MAMKVGRVVRAGARWGAITIFAASVLLGVGSAVYGYFWGIHPMALALSALMCATAGGFIAVTIMLIGYAAFPPGRG